MHGYLIQLADLYGRHLGITHWAVSYRIFRKGDFFSRIQSGKDCTLKTCARVLQWFSDNWPADLPWPSDIPRTTPNSTPKEAA